MLESTRIRLPEPSLLPTWFRYPRSFHRVVEQNLVNLEPWHLMDRDEVLNRIQGLSIRYPGRELVPFARRQDNDDVACWEKGSDEMVLLIHDFAFSGYEDRRRFPDFWTWFKGAVEEMIEFEP